VVDVADGRVRRGERNRSAIIDALLSLYDEGVLRPSVGEVAKRAGLSARTVHNHFEDVEALRAEVADAQWRRHAHLAEPPSADAPLDERIEGLVASRSAFFEAVTPVRRAALLSVQESPTIAKRLSRVSRMLRSQIEVLFATELAHAPKETLDALDACTSWEVWERLRTQQRCSASTARRVMSLTVCALVEGR
jgi:AcrR family transcriptional regulator